MIIKFVVYDPDTGEILRSGTNTRRVLNARGVSWLEGTGRPRTHYVDLTGPEPVIRRRGTPLEPDPLPPRDFTDVDTWIQANIRNDMNPRQLARALSRIMLYQIRNQ